HDPAATLVALRVHVGERKKPEEQEDEPERQFRHEIRLWPHDGLIRLDEAGKEIRIDDVPNDERGNPRDDGGGGDPGEVHGGLPLRAHYWAKRIIVPADGLSRTFGRN